MSATIEVYCEEPSHEGRRWSRTYERADSRWGADTGPSLLRGSAHITWLPEVPVVGGRHKLRCRHCGLCVERRDEVLQDGLTRLADAGVTQIRLAALGAMI